MVSEIFCKIGEKKIKSYLKFNQKKEIESIAPNNSIYVM